MRLKYLFCVNMCVLVAYSSVSSAFVIQSSISRRRGMKQVLFVSDFEDLSNNDSAEVREGRDLARKFYEEVARQEEQASSKQEVKDPSTTNTPKPINTKYTGRKKGDLDLSGSPSAGLFAQENGMVYAFPTDRNMPSGTSERTTPKETMMRNEFNLVRIASSEVSLIVQMIAVFVLLGFTLYVGISGGITDGSERFGTVPNEFNGIDESIDFSSISSDDASSTPVSPIRNPSTWI